MWSIKDRIENFKTKWIKQIKIKKREMYVLRKHDICLQILRNRMQMRNSKSRQESVKWKIEKGLRLHASHHTKIALRSCYCLTQVKSKRSNCVILCSSVIFASNQAWLENNTQICFLGKFGHVTLILDYTMKVLINVYFKIADLHGSWPDHVRQAPSSF